MNRLSTRFGAKALQRAVILGLVGALLTGFVAAQAVSSTSLGNQSIKLAYEQFADDADVTVAAVGIVVVGSTVAASGAVEMDDTLPAINNALTKGNYAYRFEVKETGVDALAADDDLYIEVYGDDGTTTTLLTSTALDAQQATADSAIEGVTVTVDLGSSTVVHDTFDVIVTRQ